MSPRRALLIVLPLVLLAAVYLLLRPREPDYDALFEKIGDHMTEAEVEAILGPPRRAERREKVPTTYRAFGADHEKHWYPEGQDPISGVSVWFDDQGRVVVAIGPSHPPTLFERAWGYLRGLF